MKKKIVFTLLSQNKLPSTYLSKVILKKKSEISIKQLLDGFKEISPLEKESEDEIMKLARYIVEDNNSDFTKVDLQTSISSSLASLIFKHLFKTDLSLTNLQEIEK